MPNCAQQSTPISHFRNTRHISSWSRWEGQFFVPRAQANQDVEASMAYYLTENGEKAALGFRPLKRYPYLVLPVTERSGSDLNGRGLIGSLTISEPPKASESPAPGLTIHRSSAAMRSAEAD